MPQTFQSIWRLAQPFLLPIICSILIHILILVTLANYFSSFGTKKSISKNKAFTVELKTILNESASRPIVMPIKATKAILPKSLENDNDKPVIIPQENPSLLKHELSVPIYYSMKELDRVPSILENVDSNPPELLQFPQGGKLSIRIWIDEEGNVERTELIKSDLPEEFNESALKSFKEAKFTPGIRNNIPVKTVASITVKYASKDSDHSNQQGEN